MKITSQIFQAYLKCHTKCWLISLGKKGKGNEYAAWVRDRNLSCYSAGIKRLFEGLPKKECLFPSTKEDLKMPGWRWAANLLVESDFSDTKTYSFQKLLNRSHMIIASQEFPSASSSARVALATHLQAVERISSKQERRTAQYIPIRFISRCKITQADRLMLGFDALTLSKAFGHNLIYAKIIRGDDYSASKVKTIGLLGKVRKLVEKIVTLLENPFPPDLVLNRNCPECEFKSECQQKAIEKDDLSLLQSMTAKEREMNHRKGIFAVNQLSYTFRPRRRPRRHRGMKEKYHHSLKALAIRENKIHVAGNPELKIDGTPVSFDVEALPDLGFYYLIGLRIRNKSSTDQYSLWADSVKDEEVIWRQFLDILGSVENPVLIHYGSFETTFFRDMTKRYGKLPEGSVAANAIKSAVNLLSVIFGQIYFPHYSNGLKDISRFLGFEWSEPNASGTQAILWRESWQNSHDGVFKEKLITYNSEDCEAVCRIMDCLINISNRNSEVSSTSANDFVSIDSLPSAFPFRYRKIQFAFPELEEINRAAYWDYQRERLRLKSNTSPKTGARKVAKSRRIKLPPNKVISFPAPSLCPTCGKTKIYKHQAYTKKTLDLKYNNSGIKRWIIKSCIGGIVVPHVTQCFLLQSDLGTAPRNSANFDHVSSV